MYIHITEEGMIDLCISIFIFIEICLRFVYTKCFYMLTNLCQLSDACHPARESLYMGVYVYNVYIYIHMCYVYMYTYIYIYTKHTHNQKDILTCASATQRNACVTLFIGVHALYIYTSYILHTYIYIENAFYI